MFHLVDFMLQFRISANRRLTLDNGEREGFMSLNPPHGRGGAV